MRIFVLMCDELESKYLVLADDIAEAKALVRKEYRDGDNYKLRLSYDFDVDRSKPQVLTEMGYTTGLGE